MRTLLSNYVSNGMSLYLLKDLACPNWPGEMGVTEEEAGRMVRYRFFDQVLQKVEGHKIALGHHRDDQAETILHNILRGTGMQGLRGMKPVRNRKFIRPLLNVTRSDIERYCRDNGLGFRIDATNRDTGYTKRTVSAYIYSKNFNRILLMPLFGWSPYWR